MTAYQTFLNGVLDLLNFNLAESFDFEKCLACGTVDRLGDISWLDAPALDYANGQD